MHRLELTSLCDILQSLSRLMLLKNPFDSSGAAISVARILAVMLSYMALIATGEFRTSLLSEAASILRVFHFGENFEVLRPGP
jgi:hypothetical protein